MSFGGEISDGLSAKLVRTLTRMTFIEPIEEAGSVWLLALLDLSLDDALMTLVVPQLIFVALMMLASLACEQLAKSLAGIEIVVTDETADVIDGIDNDADHDDNDEENNNNNNNVRNRIRNDRQRASPRVRFVPAWRRQLALLAWLPLLPLDYARLALGLERLGDARQHRRVVCLRANMPPIMQALVAERIETSCRCAARCLSSTLNCVLAQHNDCRLARPWPLSSMFASIGRIALLALSVGALLPRGYGGGGGGSTNARPVANLFDAMVALRDSSPLGASLVGGERVRIASMFAESRDMLGLVPTPNARQGAVSAATTMTRDATHVVERRAYTTHAGARIELDVGVGLWQRVGLWYGAEFDTPHGAAMLVGVDDLGALWFQYDVTKHVTLVVATVRGLSVGLVSFGAPLTLEQLAAVHGVVLREDHRLVNRNTLASLAGKLVVDASGHAISSTDGNSFKLMPLVRLDELVPEQRALVKQVIDQHVTLAADAKPSRARS